MHQYEDEIDYSGGAATSTGAIAYQNTYVARVYGIMFLGLLVTGILAVLASMDNAVGHLFYQPVASAGRGVIGYQPTPLFWMALIGDVGIWLVYLFGSQRMSWRTAGVLFFLYSACNGVVLSTALLMYTKTSVAAAFFVTSGLFGLFALYGHFTKRDLTSVGSLAFMGFIGLLGMSLLNFFLFRSVSIYWFVTYAFIPIFLGIVAWQSQSIKQNALLAMEGTDEARHSAIMDALGLYIQFINILWHLIRILGDRR